MTTEMQRVWHRVSKVGLSCEERTIQCPFPPHSLGPWSRQGTFNGERYNLRNVALGPACRTQCLEGRRLVKSVRKLRTGFLALRNTCPVFPHTADNSDPILSTANILQGGSVSKGESLASLSIRNPLYGILNGQLP